MTTDHRRRRVLGAIQAFLGRNMHAFGRLFRSRSLQAEGDAERLRGRLNRKGAQDAAQLESRARRAGEKTKGTIARAIGPAVEASNERADERGERRKE